MTTIKGGVELLDIFMHLSSREVCSEVTQPPPTLFIVCLLKFSVIIDLFDLILSGLLVEPLKPLETFNLVAIL